VGMAEVMLRKLRRLLCRHHAVTYHGHPDAPRGLCLECGNLRKPRRPVRVDVELRSAEGTFPQLTEDRYR
jgi:hypothetical protein